MRRYEEKKKKKLVLSTVLARYGSIPIKYRLRSLCPDFTPVIGSVLEVG